MIKPDFRYNVSIRDVTVSQKGLKPKVLKSSPFEDCIPYLDITALETGEIKQYTYKQLGNLTTKEDVLVVWDGSRCGLTLRGMEGALGSTIMCLTPVGLQSEYLYYFLKSKYDLINMNSTGTGIPHVDSNLLYDLQIPLVPYEVQNEIVQAIELKRQENLSLLRNQKEMLLKSIDFETTESYEEEIDQVIINIKNTFLNRAFTGDLTDNWRKFNGVNKNSWKTQNFEEISNLITSGSRDWTKYYSKKGARFIRTQDIKDNVVNKEKMIFVDLPQHVEGKRTYVEIGDLLLTIVGSNIGKCAIIDDTFQEEGYVNQAIALIKLKEDVNPNFIHLFMQSPLAQSQIGNKIYGDAQPDLNLKDIREFTISLPSLEEQEFIIEKVNKLLSTLEDIQSNFRKILDNSKNLEKSILEDVFSKEEIHSSNENNSFQSVFSHLKDQKEQIELIRRSANKSKLKLKQQIIHDMDKEESLIEILKLTPNIATEELWRESVYFEKKDVESFYAELSQLEKNKLIATSFNDESKTLTYINLL